MRFYKLTGIMLCTALSLGLVGCTDSTPESQAAQDSTNRLLICNGYGYDGYDSITRVFNSSGELIAQTDTSSENSSEEIWLVTDKYERQSGVAVVTRYYSEDEFYTWGSPVITETQYRFLDLNGNEVSSAKIPANHAGFEAPDGVSGDIIFFNCVDSYQSDDGIAYYEVYDKMGELIMHEQLFHDLEDEGSNYAYLYYNGDLLVINHDAWNSDWSKNYQRTYVFARQGESTDFAAKKLAQDYVDISPLYSENGNTTTLWRAKYQPTPGTYLYDILNPDGTVRIEGLNSILNNGAGLIFAQIGDEKVLLDIDGKRLYSESIFNELDD